MSQFLNTLAQIQSCDSVRPVRGVISHLHWQVRRLFGLFPCELTIGDSRLRVDRPSGVAALVNAMGEYDYNNMELLKFVLIQRPSNFIDVGANIGSYTLIASEIAHAKVVSIEAHPITFKLLENNIRLNHRKNVVSLNVAASRVDSELRLTDGDDPSLNHVLESDEPASRELSVACRRIQTLCTELNIVPDFIKIDVEGHELAVLAGLGTLKTVANIIFIEGGERPDIKTWMRATGYSGPWFVHFKRRLLSLFTQQRAEDPIFIQKSYLTKLQQLDFNIVNEMNWP